MGMRMNQLRFVALPALLIGALTMTPLGVAMAFNLPWVSMFMFPGMFLGLYLTHLDIEANA